MVTALGPTPTSAAMMSVQGAAQALRTPTALYVLLAPFAWVLGWPRRLCWGQEGDLMQREFYESPVCLGLPALQ